ncbi:MAG TPA: PspC domain-containing protein [Allosphingosinicella sp.]|nr:PspC domain-containing protein [Allosphingosinicella sp.]
MRVRGRQFEVDKGEGKFLGVCAGLSNMTGADVTIIRVGVVLATLMLFPWVPIAYFLAAWLGKPKGAGGYDRVGRYGSDTSERIQDIDRRMAAIESYVTSPNRQLANEIDSLR